MKHRTRSAFWPGLLCAALTSCLFATEGLAQQAVGPRLRNTEEVQTFIRATYPADLKEARVGGMAEIELVVGIDGMPGEISIIQSSGHPSLDSTGVRAARQMRFVAASVNGEAAVTRVRFPVTFIPPPGGPVTLPGAPFSAIVDLPPGYHWVSEDSIDGMMRKAVNGPGTIQVWMSRDRRGTSGTACREQHNRRARSAPVERENVQESEAPPLAMRSYTMSRMGGIPLRMEHQWAFYGAGGYCLALQFTKLESAEVDPDVFQKLVAGLRIEPATAP